jgi:hypothetical protein
MNWSYSGDPADSPLDETRFLLGDTTETAHSLSDEEITFLLTRNANDAYRAGAEAAGILAVRFIGLSATTKKVGDLTLTTEYQAQAERYFALEAKLLEGRTRYNVGAPTMADTSSNIFAVGMMDQVTKNPRLL